MVVSYSVYFGRFSQKTQVSEVSVLIFGSPDDSNSSDSFHTLSMTGKRAVAAPALLKIATV